MPSEQLAADRDKLGREVLELAGEDLQHPPRQLGQAVVGLVADRRDQLRDMAGPWGAMRPNSAK
jgi:hypothetical protein